MTFSAWLYVPTPLANPSNPSEKLTAKGAILSFNGTGVEPVWPSFVYLLDNEGVNEETGKAWMQFNGRVDFLSVEGKPLMWPNASDEAYAAKDKWIHVARTYDATTAKASSPRRTTARILWVPSMRRSLPTATPSIWAVGPPVSKARPAIPG